MEGLNLDNILGEQDINSLFEEPEMNATEESAAETKEQKAPESTEEELTTTEEEQSGELFGDAPAVKPEGVGSGKKEEKEEDTIPDKDGGTSPNENFYSSIANALVVDGIILNSDEDKIKEVTDAESFSEMIEAEIAARLDEKQQRVAKALENGVEPDEIRKYEAVLHRLSSMTEDIVSEESERGEQLRRQLIYQDYLNKGMSESKAQKLTERSIDAGNDIDDAKEALQSNKEYFQGQYNTLLKDAQKRADEEKAERVKEAEKLKNSLLKDKTLLGDLEVSNDVRKKAYEAISRPTYRDPETGEYMTAVQKYEMENHSDFIKYVGLFYTLTNGFKDFDSFTKGKVAKEVKKGIRELEKTLNNTRRNSDGSLKMVTGVNEDPESFMGGNFRLAL